jgi:hypothetical protein
MTLNEASSCIDKIDDAERKIADYNRNWNVWDIEYRRLEQEISNKETEINNEDLKLYNWVILQLQTNTKGWLKKRGYDYDGREGCGNWPSNSCHNFCNEDHLDTYRTPRGRRPSSIGHYHTHMEHCKWQLSEWDTYRCYCVLMNDDSHNLFYVKKANINELINQKTTLQNTINTHARNMPQFPPITLKCCSKVIECDNKIYGPNSCYGNLQICKQNNFNILDNSKRTELEIANKAKILAIDNNLNPLFNQIRELYNTIFTLSKNVSNLINNNSISNSISSIKEIYNKISELITKIETIKNINNLENEAKELFNYITADTTHKREMQDIFETIKTKLDNIRNVILQAKNIFTIIKNIYETLLNEDLNINLLKIEQNKILVSIKKLNDYLDSLKIMKDTINSSIISSQEDFNKLLEIYNKAIILVKNINLEIKDLNEFRNELTNIYNKFTINSFFINNVKVIYNDSIKSIDNILKRINEFNIDNIIENMYSILLKNKNIFENQLLKIDEEKLKIIQDEELKKIKIINQISDNKLINVTDNKLINDTGNKLINDNIKKEEGINIIYIVIGIIIVFILFLYTKK